MKWAVRLAIGVYPRWWRRRYGPELEALLEDAPPGWSALFDLVRGACIMRLRNARTIPVAAALVGASLGTAIWLRTPAMFASSALIRLPLSGSVLEHPESDGARAFRDRLARAVPTLDARNATAVTVVELGTASSVVRVSSLAVDANGAQDVVRRVVDAMTSPGDAWTEATLLTPPTLPTVPEETGAAPVMIGAGVGLALGVAVTLWRRGRTALP
jgi:hypothetical protein